MGKEKPRELPSELAADVRGAWHRFIEHTEHLRPDLHRYCRSLTGSIWDAEDLVQETLLRAFAKLGEIQQEIVSPKAYLLRIASNLWIDGIRRREASPDLETTATATADEPSRRLEVRDAARELVRRLSPRERAAFVLKELFDLPLEDTAEILGTTVGTIKSALHRGRGKLAAPTPAFVPANAPSEALLDRFVDAFNAHDLDRLTALFREDASGEVIGMGTELGRAAIRDSSLRITLKELHVAGQRPISLAEDEPFAERRMLGSEAIVVLWYAPRAGEPSRVVRDVMRFESLEDRIARLRYYYFCPETLVEVGGALGVTVTTNGYRYP
jgi:RNA polymerase sigma-70 factor (ECF subfamily)